MSDHTQDKSPLAKRVKKATRPPIKSSTERNKAWRAKNREHVRAYKRDYMRTYRARPIEEPVKR